jgi:acetyl esterase/lipase
MRVQLRLRSRPRSPRSPVAIACTAAVAGLGLMSASPAAAAGGQGWAEDVGVTYQAPACAVSETGSDTAGDVYRPANPPAGPLPVVVYVHGGAFTGGVRTAADNEVIAEELATLGYVVYNIDYCLAAPTADPPVAGFPVQVLDVEDAVRALSKPGFDGGRVDVDPSRVAIWGGSAGSTLAAEAGVALGDTGATPVAAMVGWSGGYDFLDFRDGNPQAEKDARAFLGCDPQTNKSVPCQSRARKGSAALNVTATTPPMSLWNSSDELVPITQWQDMKTALAAAGIPFSATELNGHAHSNAYTHRAFCPTVTFLTSYLGPYTGTCVAPPNQRRSGAG